jgi:hypothetical protein
MARKHKEFEFFEEVRVCIIMESPIIMLIRIIM